LHQCIYLERKGNAVPRKIQPTLQIPRQDLISFAEDDDEKAKRNRGTFTTLDRPTNNLNPLNNQNDVATIDRPMNNSNPFNNQNYVIPNSGHNITEGVAVRRVPTPRAKFIVRQPTTKVVIVKIPNVAGQLVMQPKIERTDE
jgi:hypothetical protein